MAGHFGFLEANFQNLIARISNEITVISATVAITVLILGAFIAINHLRSKKILENARPARAESDQPVS
jgi:hypothetical protein